ncbi:unnamed protein product [Orchesella dallaii]|uniref:Uncharacterized protein n=1 Tax=Orchesella dallaii TaxID=48710 RepID=A0ABP1PMZ0_9HEXA
MNKALALTFLATVAIIVAVEVGASHQHNRWLRPGLLPWIPLNIPRPAAPAPAPVVPPTTVACPAGGPGCTACGTATATKCDAGDGAAAQGTCLPTGTTCPAGCTGTPCPPACAAGCTP